MTAEDILGMMSPPMRPTPVQKSPGQKAIARLQDYVKIKAQVMRMTESPIAREALRGEMAFLRMEICAYLSVPYRMPE